VENFITADWENIETIYGYRKNHRPLKSESFSFVRKLYRKYANLIQKPNDAINPNNLPDFLHSTSLKLLQTIGTPIPIVKK
jgi:hypothetical protein